MALLLGTAYKSLFANFVLEIYADLKRRLLVGGVQILITFFWNLSLTVYFFFVFTWCVYVSIETAKQKMEKDILHQKADLKILRKRKKITELQKEFKQLLNLNQSLPRHLRLTHQVHMRCHRSNTLESMIWNALHFMSSGLNTLEKLLKQFDTGRHTSSRLKQSVTNQRGVVFSQRGEDTSCTKTTATCCPDRSAVSHIIFSFYFIY